MKIRWSLAEDSIKHNGILDRDIVVDENMELKEWIYWLSSFERE